MKTVPIELAVEQTNESNCLLTEACRRSTEPLKTMACAAPLQPRLHREILSRSASTGTENCDCVLPKMSAMINDHALSIINTNLVPELIPLRCFSACYARVDALPEPPFS